MARKFDRYMVQIGMGTHPKFGDLTDAEFRAHVVGVLAIAAMSPVRGCLLVGEAPARPVHVACVAGVSRRVAASTLQKLEDVGVLRPDDELDCLRVWNWDDVNPAPKHDPTNAERQRRYREQHPKPNAANNAAVTLPVTPPEVKKGKDVAKATSFSSAPGAADKLTREREKASEDDRRLCRLQAQLAKAHNPKFKVKSEAEWLRSMRLSRERDGNEPAHTERLLRWLYSDKGRDATFWVDVIQSPANLREHFAQLWGKMIATPIHAVQPVEDSAAYLARRGAA